MSQIFHPSLNSISKVSIAILVIVVLLLLVKGNVFVRSPYLTGVGVAIEQLIPFSHKHHVSGLGIDCRYCHIHAENSAFAGIPSTETCMSCHSQVWTETPMLQPVRDSWATGKPIEWNRVHDVADFVFFDHSIHVNSGVSCTTCHGQVENMPLIWRKNSLHMSWCLDCHRNPEPYLVAPDKVFVKKYESSRTSTKHENLHQDMNLMDLYEIEKEQLMNCSICHR